MFRSRHLPRHRRVVERIGTGDAMWAEHLLHFRTIFLLFGCSPALAR